MTVPRPAFRIAGYIFAGVLALHLVNLWLASKGSGAATTAANEALIRHTPAVLAMSDSLGRDARRADSLKAILEARLGSALSTAQQDSALLARALTTRDSLRDALNESGAWEASFNECQAVGVQSTRQLADASKQITLLNTLALALQDGLTAQLQVKPPRCGFTLGGGVLYWGKFGVGGAAIYGCRL